MFLKSRPIKVFLICSLFFNFDALASAVEVYKNIENQLHDAYLEIQKDQKIYAWEIAGPRDKTSYRCRELCWCIADNLAKKIPNYKKVKVTVTQKGGVDVLNKFNTEKWYIYHVVLGILDESNSLFVVDPLVMGDTRLVPFEDWKKRFKDNGDLKFTFMNYTDY